MELRLLALYPEQMNIYADRGNILFLRRRCEWRGVGFRYAASGPGASFDPEGHDLRGAVERNQEFIRLLDCERLLLGSQMQQFH